MEYRGTKRGRALPSIFENPFFGVFIEKFPKISPQIPSPRFCIFFVFPFKK